MTRSRTRTLFVGLFRNLLVAPLKQLERSRLEVSFGPGIEQLRAYSKFRPPSGWRGSNPEGVESQSPGLLYSATLGWLCCVPTLTGLRPTGAYYLYRCPLLSRARPQPLQGWRQTTNTPFAHAVAQGSGVPQPWALGRNPFGVV